jgi:hypothetical protein
MLALDRNTNKFDNYHEDQEKIMKLIKSFKNSEKP